MVASPEARLSAAKTVYDMLTQYAYRNGLGFDWVVATMAIAAQESGFDPDAANIRPPSPGDTGEASYGIWQINLNVHPLTPDQARDPAQATAYWLANLPSVSSWQACGGSKAFSADPNAMMQCYAPKTQKSVGWDAAIADRALTLSRGTIGQITGSAITGNGGLPGDTGGGIPNPIDAVGGAIGGATDAATAAVDATKQLASAATSIVGAVNLLTNSKTYERGAVFILGGVLVVAGIVVMLSGSQTVISMAKGAAAA